ncbi:MAG TPA: Fic family protein [Pyrinomonadaceae bacterium]|nr:Fic family protein [Pyrinomonadaceae bacterium]
MTKAKTKTGRKFEVTHPWITFDVDLRSANPELWMMLGECQSKCEHLAKYPLRPDIAAEIHKMYMAKGVLATTAIEGNTLSEKEVREILDGTLKLAPSREYLEQEVKNIIGECNRILNQVKRGNDLVLSTDRVIEMNRTILSDLVLSEGVKAGEIRGHEVVVAIYKGAPAEDCKYLLDQLCEWLNDKEYFGSTTDARAMVNGILKAVLAHLYVAWIHPFGDGNGRTARLMELQILISSRVPSPAAQLLSNHYYETRQEYYRQLHMASQTKNILPFIMYAVQGFLDGLKSQLEWVKKQVLEVVWQNYVTDQFLEKTKASDLRRRDLIEDLSRIEPEAISYQQLPLISPRVAKNYANKTTRTLIRDVEELHRMRLLQYDKGLIRARKEEILAFLPTQATLQKKLEKETKRSKSKAKGEEA